ncbi:MAG: hypothetical protein KDI75_07125 [Xanthomonadales bacterium]|nr:hypothetical protein [Xanthomonadales bacterium]
MSGKDMFIGMIRVALLLGLVTPLSALKAQTTERLTIGEGVVVKFGSQAGLDVHASLNTEQGAVLTSLADDSLAGQTGTQPATATAGDWLGVHFTDDVASSDHWIDGLSIRFAETGLRVDGGEHAFERLELLDNITGIVVSQAALAGFDGVSLHRNGVGLESSQDAQVTVGGSDISGNAAGISNLSPAFVVNAEDNWWGSVNGPTAADNPGGDGDSVSAGVSYGQYQQVIPLLACSLTMADGRYTVSLPDVMLNLACRNAVEYRLAAGVDFTGIAFQPMAATAQFTLQPPAGSKPLHAEYRAQTGNTQVVSLPMAINYAPAPASVAFVAPEDNAEVVADTTIIADAASDVGIDRVEFFVGNQLIGTDTQAPYEQLWSIDGFLVGDYVLRVVAYPTAGQSAQATRTVRLRPATGDATPPSITNLRFNGATLSDGAVLDAPGMLQFSVSAPSGIKHAEVRLNGVVAWSAGYGGDISTWFGFSGFPDGLYTLEVHATNEFDVPMLISRQIELAIEAPSAPELLAPGDGITVHRPQLAVNGTTQPRSRVQVYLDGNPVGGRITASPNGSFGTTLALPSEGLHSISVDAENSRGVGASSVAHEVNYSPTNPQVTFVNPQPDAILQADTDLTLAIVDATGVTEVEFLLDGEPLATRTVAPWSFTWPIDSVADGAHTLTALAVNAAARTAQAEVNVTVQKLPPPPPPVPTPYVGELISLAPVTSYGEQPIVIQGRAVERANAEPVPSALLQVWLEVDNYLRKINVATDATGSFQFAFQPAASDAGIYSVSVRHPEQADATWQDQFTIDRVHLYPSSYRLHAARTVTATIPVRVTASAGNGVAGLRFEAPASEQPSGSLPPDVQIIAPEPISLAAGATRTLDIGFLGGSAAPQTGTIVLVAYEQGSGSVVRGRVSVPFQLSEPLPALIPSPTSLQGGLAQGEQISLSAQLRNQGVLAAEGVTVQLLDGNGTGPAPSWMNLSSPANLGALVVGASQPLSLTANPDASISDGVYQARLRVAAANTTGGDIPVAISVTQSGEGDARFHVADIYTQTLGEDGNPIPGLANARIRIQHETIPTLNVEVFSDAEGIAEVSDLAAGYYTYRASAAGHNDASGRIRIQPGVIAEEDVFLDMDVVSIEWSVTETTIPDQYDVVIEATYQTEVPAPVVLIEPPFINLPALQAGEEFSGELTISNYGLVRADNLEFTPPADDAYLSYEFMGEVPGALEARERVTIAYKVTALQPLGSIARLPLSGKGVQTEPVASVFKTTSAKSGESCSSYRNAGLVRYDFYCANGDQRQGACATAWGLTLGGSQCAVSGPSGGNNGGDAGGWWGAGGYGAPLYDSPGCTPNCKKCCKGGGAPGGGGSGGGGGGGAGPGPGPGIGTSGGGL